jgi:hypothetical protein
LLVDGYKLHQSVQNKLPVSQKIQASQNIYPEQIETNVVNAAR